MFRNMASNLSHGSHRAHCCRRSVTRRKPQQNSNSSDEDSTPKKRLPPRRHSVDVASRLGRQTDGSSEASSRKPWRPDSQHTAADLSALHKQLKNLKVPFLPAFNPFQFQPASPRHCSRSISLPWMDSWMFSKHRIIADHHKISRMNKPLAKSCICRLDRLASPFCILA